MTYKPTTKKEAIMDALRGVQHGLASEEITMMVWRKHPEMFALKYFPKHPDHNKTRNTIYGPHGLKTEGYLTQVEDRFFVNHEKAALLLNPDGVATTVRRDKFLASLWDSAAACLYRKHGPKRIEPREQRAMCALGLGDGRKTFTEAAEYIRQRLRDAEQDGHAGFSEGEFRLLKNIVHCVLDGVKWERYAVGCAG